MHYIHVNLPKIGWSDTMSKGHLTMNFRLFSHTSSKVLWVAMTIWSRLNAIKFCIDIHVPRRGKNVDFEILCIRISCYNFGNCSILPPNLSGQDLNFSNIWIYDHILGKLCKMSIWIATIFMFVTGRFVINQ